MLTAAHTPESFQSFPGLPVERKSDPGGWGCPADHLSLSHLRVPVMPLVLTLVQLSVGLLNTSNRALSAVGSSNERLLALWLPHPLEVAPIFTKHASVTTSNGD